MLLLSFLFTGSSGVGTHPHQAIARAGRVGSGSCVCLPRRLRAVRIAAADSLAPSVLLAWS